MPALLARHTRAAELPTVLDFAFANAVRAAVLIDGGRICSREVFAGDALYEGGEAYGLEVSDVR